MCRRLASVVLVFASLNLVACRANPEIAQIAPTESPTVVAPPEVATRATDQPAPSGEVSTSATAPDAVPDAMPDAVWLKTRGGFDVFGDPTDPRDAPDGARLPHVEFEGSINRTNFYVIRDADPATRVRSRFECGDGLERVGDTRWRRWVRVPR